MRVEEKNNIKVEDIEPGKCFKRGDEIFLKTDEHEGKRDMCVDIQTGEVCWIYKVLDACPLDARIEDMRKPKGEAIIDMKPGTVFRYRSGVWIRSEDYHNLGYHDYHSCAIVNLETGELMMIERTKNPPKEEVLNAKVVIE